MDLLGGPMEGDDDEAVSVPLSDAPKKKARGTPTPGAPNESIDLTSYFTKDERKKVSDRACDDFDADVESRDKHMRRQKRWFELYASVMKAKTWPFDRAANVNVPLATYTTLQIQGRLFDMILPAKGNIFHSMPTDAAPDEIDRADRTEKFLNYNARHEIDGFVQVYDECLFQMAICGSAFRYDEWDDVAGNISPVCVPIQDMVVPYNAKATSPTMRGVPRYTRVLHMTYFDMLDAAARKYFYSDSKEGCGVARIKPEASDETKESEIEEAISDIAGLEKAGAEATPGDEDRQVLQQFIRWYTMPDDAKRHPSFDGKPHAVIAWVDADTKELLRFVIREEENPKDRIRFDREMQAYQQYQQDVANFVQKSGRDVDPQTGAIVPLPAPQPVDEPEPVRMREVCMFTHYRAFPSPGFYGLGYGDIVGPLNEAMNTILNQNIDRVTMNLAGGGFKSRQLRFQTGPILMQPGQFIEIDAPPAALKDGLKMRDPIPAEPHAMSILALIEGWAQRTAGSGDTLSGEPVGANETKAAAELRTQQAMKQITVLAGRVLSYMKCDVDRFWRLYSVFLPEQSTAGVMDASGAPTTIPISRSDFVADARVFPVADPRITSKDDRVSDAQDAFAMAMQNPLMANNPKVLRALTERILHAREMQDIIPMLEPVPPPPPPPVPQEEENASFLQGQQPQVNPADNDDEHLAKIYAFKGSPEHQAMTPEMSNALDQHARNHIAQKMKKEAANARNGTQAGGPIGAPGGGDGGMAPAPGNGAAPATPPGGNLPS